MREQGKSSRIGTLLLMSGVIDRAQLSEAEQMASSTGLDVGKMLKMSGYVDGRILKLAAEAEKLIVQGELDESTAAQAMSMAHNRDMDLPTALKAATTKPKVAAETTSLSELLAESDALAKSDLAQAEKQAEETGLPLGRIISHSEAVRPEVVIAALCGLIYQREGQLNRQQLIDLTTACVRKGCTFEKAMEILNIEIEESPPEIGLVGLLTQANLVAMSNMITAMELSMLKGTPLMREIAALGQAEDRVLAWAQHVLSLIAINMLAEEHGPVTLRRIVLNGESPPTALGEIAALVLDEGDFDDLDRMLNYSGAVSDMVLVPLRVSLSEHPAFVEYLGAIMNAKVISEQALLAASRLLYLVRLDSINSDQAISFLKYAIKNEVSADEAIQSLTLA